MPKKIYIDDSNLSTLTNDKYYSLYKNEDRYLVLWGGG